MSTPEFAVRDAAIVICTLDDSLYHHDRTDDMPCATCLIVAQAAIEAAFPYLVAQISEEIAAEIDRLTVSNATLNHPYPIDAATHEAANVARNFAAKATR